MKKLLLLLTALATVVAVTGCSNEPRDATNDPEVKAMLKGVNEQGVMPGNGSGGAQAAPAGSGSAAPTAVGN